MENDDDDEKPTTSSGTSKPCLHCLIRETIDAYSEHMHTTTGETVASGDLIEILLSNACELIAWQPDAKFRNEDVKAYQNLLAEVHTKVRRDRALSGWQVDTRVAALMRVCDRTAGLRIAHPHFIRPILGVGV